MTKTISHDELKALMAGHKPVLVDFFATWCQPCKAMAPAIDALATELGDTVEVVKVDVDESFEAAAEFQVRGVPTFVVIRQGLVAAKRSGAMPAGPFKQWVETAVAA